MRRMQRNAAPVPAGATVVSQVGVNERLVGTYAAVSGTPAFGMLNAMVVAGDAVLLDERYDALGAKWTTVEIGGHAPHAAEHTPNAMMRMRSSAREFVAVLKDYVAWPEAWWREAIQNAVDAGATQVDCTVEELPDGQWKCTCTDNGSGMDERTLYDIFLVAGATSKGAGDTGGFGQAKKLLFVAWGYWEIHTRDLLVVGQNDMHEDHPVPASYIQGTRLTATMPADLHTDLAAAMETRGFGLAVPAFTLRARVRDGAAFLLTVALCGLSAVGGAMISP